MCSNVQSTTLVFCGSCCCCGGGGGVSDFSLKTAAATAFSSPLISAEMIEGTDTIRLLGNRAIEVINKRLRTVVLFYMKKSFHLCLFSAHTHTQQAEQHKMMYIIGTFE